MIYVAAGSVVFFGIFAYVLFMVFLPEWVGITGKTALKNEQSHLGLTAEEIAAQEALKMDQAKKSETSNPPKD